MGPAGTCSSGVSVVEYLLLLPRVAHPVGQRQMGGRGGPSNYYAITHKPIDLDWTPGGVLRDRGPGPTCYKTLENSRVLEIERKSRDSGTIL